MDQILKWTEELNPIIQGLIGSAIFSIAIWLGRVIWKTLVELNRDLKIKREKEEITKIILHKHYINRNGLYYYSLGYLRVIFKALFHLFRGLIFYVSTIAVTTLIKIPFLETIGLYFCVQELISGLSWINPKWARRDLKAYDIHLANEIITEFTSKDPMRGDKIDGLTPEQD